MTDEECLQFLNKFKAIPWSKLKIKYNNIFVYLIDFQIVIMLEKLIID